MTSLFDRFTENCRRQGDRAAIVHAHPQVPQRQETSTSYAELESKARTAAAWVARKTAPGTIVPLYLNRSAEAAAFMMGCLGAGRAFTFVNRKMQPPQLERILQDTRSPLLVTDGPGLLALRRGLQGSEILQSVEWVVLPSPFDQAIHDKTRAGLAERLRIGKLVLGPSIVPDGASAPADPGSPLLEPLVPTRGQDPACSLFTSGSTGNPKGVLIADDDLLRRAEEEISCFQLTPADVLLNVLPWSFDVGLNQLLSTLVGGGRMVLLDSWLPVEIRATVEAYGVTGISGVPSVWRDLLGAGLNLDSGSLRYVTVSGGSLDNDLLEALGAAVAPAGIIKTYGQTEAFRATCLLPGELRDRPGSVGRSFGGVRLYIVDERHRPLPPGQIGQVVHSGLGTMLGYLGQSDEDKLIPNPYQGENDRADKVILTGDFGYLDSDGFLYLKGRKDHMLKIKGNRVYPEEIADQLMAMEAFHDAHIVAPEIAGEMRLAAFVRLKANAQAGELAGEGALKRAAAARLPSYMQPERFLVLDRVPLTASGKPDTPLLEQMARDAMLDPS